MESIQYTIIGAGILGLQMGLGLVEKGVNPADIAIFEQNIFAGEHSSSRNSGVLHAGLYYPTNSLKQQHCVLGNKIWRDICQKLGIYINECGKYVVATKTSEVAELDKLFCHALSKKVEGLTYTDAKEIRDFVNVEKAFFSRNTALIDVSEAIKKIVNYLEKKNVLILMGQKISARYENNNFILRCNDEIFKTQYLINTAGLFGTIFREGLGLRNIESHYVKGHYLRLKKGFFNKSLIYPLPPKDLHGLGVHTSFDKDGIVHFGPDALGVDSINYEMDNELIDKMFPAITKVFKGINKGDLELAYAGVRSKIIKSDSPYNDFVIDSPIENYIECLGIESPGLTASPSIARRALEMLV